MEFCKEKELTPVADFSDIAIGSNFDRPGWKNLLFHLQNTPVENRRVIATCFSRFFRGNSSDVKAMEEKLKELGVELITCR